MHNAVNAILRRPTRFEPPPQRVAERAAVTARVAFEVASAPGVSYADRIDATNCVIHGVKILGLESKNTGRVIGLDSRQFGEAADKPYAYTPEALQTAIPLYEGAHVFSNHTRFDFDERGARRIVNAERQNEDLIGFLSNVQYVDGQGLYGDLNYNPDHAVTETLLWVANKKPDLMALSHEAIFDAPQVANGRIYLTKISGVDSVALVSSKPGTTNGLFESLATEHQNMDWTDTLRNILESTPQNTPGRRVLEQMIGEAVPPVPPHPPVPGAPGAPPHPATPGGPAPGAPPAAPHPAPGAPPAGPPHPAPGAPPAAPHPAPGAPPAGPPHPPASPPPGAPGMVPGGHPAPGAAPGAAPAPHVPMPPAPGGGDLNPQERIRQGILAAINQKLETADVDTLRKVLQSLGLSDSISECSARQPAPNVSEDDAVPTETPPPATGAPEAVESTPDPELKPATPVTPPTAAPAAAPAAQPETPATPPFVERGKKKTKESADAIPHEQLVMECAELLSTHGLPYTQLGIKALLGLESAADRLDYVKQLVESSARDRIPPSMRVPRSAGPPEPQKQNAVAESYQEPGSLAGAMLGRKPA